LRSSRSAAHGLASTDEMTKGRGRRRHERSGELMEFAR